jgi:CRISPR-associated protein Csx14
MAESSIPVDLFNPGQVFACLGLMELADQLLGEAQAAFDWSDPPKVRFRVSASGDVKPVERAIAFLRNATVTSRTPSKIESGNWKDSWGSPPTLIDSNREAFPFPAPDSPATVPARLCSGDNHFDLTYWGDDVPSSGRDNVKFWAGAGGYPGAALAQDALALIKAMPADITANPLNASARQSSSFRFDWRRDYIPMEIGFSLNAHPGERFCTVGYPVVEMLAAIGLSYARPKRITKLEYHYGVASAPDDETLLDPVFLRAALGATRLPFGQRSFKMKLGWPGKENQARCITTVEDLSAS